MSFAAVIPQMASRKWRAHRSVCLPDYQGIGIGHALQAYVAAMYATVGDFTMKISAPAVIAHALRSPDWVTIAPPSRYKAAGNKGTDSPRYGMSFRFAGEAKREAAGLFGVGPQAKPARKRRPRKGGGG